MAQNTGQPQIARGSMSRMSSRATATALVVTSLIAVGCGDSVGGEPSTSESSPVALYAFAEDEGATSAADTSGNDKAPLVQTEQAPFGGQEPVSFGTGAAVFAPSGEGMYLTAPVDYVVSSIEFDFRQDGIPTLEPVLLSVTGDSGTSIGIWIDYNLGYLFISDDDGNGTFIPTDITDGESHHVQWNLADEQLVLDGGDPLDLAGSLTAVTPSKISVGGMPNREGAALDWSQAEGSIDNVTAYGP